MMSASGRHRPQHNSSHAPPSRPPPNINKMQTSQGGGQPYYGAHGANLKLESGSEGKPETNPHVSSENKMPESSNANSNSGSNNNSSGISSSSKPAAVSSTQQVDMKLSTEVGKEEKATPTSE